MENDCTGSTTKTMPAFLSSFMFAIATCRFVPDGWSDDDVLKHTFRYTWVCCVHSRPSVERRISLQSLLHCVCVSVHSSERTRKTGCANHHTHQISRYPRRTDQIHQAIDRCSLSALHSLKPTTNQPNSKRFPLSPFTRATHCCIYTHTHTIVDVPLFQWMQQNQSAVNG